MELTEPPPSDAPTRRLGRRGALGLGVGGVAATLVARRAAASPPPDDSTDGTADDATATSPPPTSIAPLRPTDADVELLAFAQSIELAARELYDAMFAALGDVPAIDDTRRAVFTALREAHDAYAQSLSGLLGRAAPGIADETVQSALTASFTTDIDAAILAAYMLESALVATHRELIAELQGTDGAALLASILLVEARHGTVLADLGGGATLDDLLVVVEADAFDRVAS